uniref:Uncharacterized protein n=1 Tax=Arion vulgaris TaxID=1028688 RepID=A0A0B7BKX4_9EUPU
MSDVSVKDNKSENEQRRKQTIHIIFQVNTEENLNKIHMAWICIDYHKNK